jgi:hypothetical protein
VSGTRAPVRRAFRRVGRALPCWGPFPKPVESGRPYSDRTVTVGLEGRKEAEALTTVRSASGPFGGQVAELARPLLEDIHAGRPVQRRGAVRLARSTLESAAVRMAAAVLEADDRQLVPRLVDLLDAALEPTPVTTAARKRTHDSAEPDERVQSTAAGIPRAPPMLTSLAAT